MSDYWRKEYAHMARQHSREIKRCVLLADAFAGWLVEHDYNQNDADLIVAEMYARASNDADAAVHPDTGRNE